MACCCGNQPSCCNCTSYPERYELVVADIVDGPNCIECNETYNGTFTLIKVAGLCQWQSTPDGFGCGGFGPAWILICEPSTGYWNLYADADNGNVCARYRKSIPTWNCLGQNTMDLLTDNPNCIEPPPHPPTSTCTGWPSTLNVTPL